MSEFKHSHPDGWYDPDGKDASMLRDIREAGAYQQSDPGRAVVRDKTEDWDRRVVDRALAGIYPPVPVTLMERLRVAINDTGYVTLAEAKEALARIAELEAEVDFQDSKTGELRARITELEAANARLRQEAEHHERALARIAELEAAVLAERKECLRIMQGCTNWYDAIDRIRARPAP